MPLITTQCRTVVVGGHARNVGKTSLVVDLIRSFPEANWTAIKITHHGHVVNSGDDKSVGPSLDPKPFSLDEEHDRSGSTDTSRYLVAGAARSLLLRTKQGRLGDAIPTLVTTIEQAKYAILESNAVLEFLSPSLYLVVLNPGQDDFKDSARTALNRADAFILRSPLIGSSWQNASSQIVEKKPHFLQPLGEPLAVSVSAFVRRHLF